MTIPELHLGHSKLRDGKKIIVKNTVYKNESQVESSFPHRHSFYVICLFLDGSGTHVVDFEEIPVKPNRLFIISPHQVHFWKLNLNTKISLIQFSESILLFDNKPVSDLLSALRLSNKFLDISDSQANEIRELILKLENESLKTDSYSDDIIRGYILILCKLIERLGKTTSNKSLLNSKEVKLQKFINSIELHFRQQKSVGFYAQKLNITANYLNMLSKKHLGKKAGELINSRVILEAKRILYHTTSDISQVAFELGFEDPSYFTRSFKRVEKKTPTEFRNEIYKKYQH